MIKSTKVKIQTEIAKSSLASFINKMAASYLTPSQIEEFHKNGLLVIENFVNQNEVKSMKDEILKLVDLMDPKEHKGVFSTTEHNQVCNCTLLVFLIMHQGSDRLHIIF